ncbi:hypothetical protein Y600_6016 [Burkholderia pseudomallei MSHR3709]|nr:hypothetical protein Y600_6016 [Burkholderia pseudomallei MSHR3709]
MNSFGAMPPETPPPSRVDRPWTSTRDVIFLGYDGVVHRGDAYRRALRLERVVSVERRHRVD